MATLLRCLHRPDVLGVEQGRKVFSWPTAPPRQQSHPERDGTQSWQLGTIGAGQWQKTLSCFFKLKTGTWSHELIC